MAEMSFQPDWFSKPGDTLLALMEQRELTSEGLALRLRRSNAVVRGLLAGRVIIDDDLALAISKHVGGTPKFWRARQERYLRCLSQAAEATPATDWSGVGKAVSSCGYGEEWMDRADPNPR